MSRLASPAMQSASAGRRAVTTLLSLMFGIATIGGCGEELGPEPMTTTSVDGSVRVQGRPFGPCWLEFTPIEGTVGLLRSARVDADGTFHASGVPVGRVAMRVVGFSGAGTGDPGLDRFISFAGQVYIIRRDIPRTPSAPLDIDLASEAVAFARRETEL